MVKLKSKKKKPIITAKQKAARRENGKKGGRPSRMPRIESIDFDLMLTLIGAGLSNEEVCREMEISTSTLQVWISTEPKLASAIEAAREKCEERIRRSLHVKAVGFYYNEEVFEPTYYLDKTLGKIVTNKELTLTKKTRKYSPPDPVAAMTFMRLHDPKGFKDKWGLTAAEGKPAIENNPTFVNNVVNNTVKPEEITDEHRRRVAANLAILQRHGGLGSVASKV